MSRPRFAHDQLRSSSSVRSRTPAARRRFAHFATAAITAALWSTTGYVAGYLPAGNHNAAVAQDVAPPADQAYQPMDADQLEQLVGPVALYPDAVLADVLAACTYPDDVIAADRWIAAGNSPDNADSQDWDDSVKSIARFPDVLHYLASNPDWMNDLGDAFLNQPSDVMDAVQSLRQQAIANGDLQSNDQEQVVNDDDTIEIIPANPQVIYVPTYDPDLVWWHHRHYAPGEVYAPLVRWGRSVNVGPWLRYDFDWHDRRIYRGDWGANRPWWHRRPGVKFDYLRERPGMDHAHGRAPVAWQRDNHRPAPRFVPRGAAPARPGVGRGATEARPGGYQRGSETERASNRGRQSRSAAQPAREQPREQPRAQPPPVRPAETPRSTPRSTPRETPSAMPREAPREAPRATPTETPRQAPRAAPRAPERSNAGGYQSGDEASRASNRGAQSRGSAESRGGGRGAAPSGATPSGGGGRGGGAAAPSGATPSNGGGHSGNDTNTGGHSGGRSQR